MWMIRYLVPCRSAIFHHTTQPGMPAPCRSLSIFCCPSVSVARQAIVRIKPNSGMLSSVVLEAGRQLRLEGVEATLRANKLSRDPRLEWSSSHHVPLSMLRLSLD